MEDGSVIRKMVQGMKLEALRGEREREKREREREEREREREREIIL